MQQFMNDSRFFKYILVIISLVIGVSLIMHSLLADQVVYASTPDDDTVDGEFQSTGYNNPVSLTKFTLEDRTRVGNIIEVVDETTSPVSVTTDVAVARAIESYEYIIPQQEYTAEFTLHDRDTYQDIDSVELRIFYNVSGSGLTNGAVMASVEGTPDSGTGAVIKWQRNVHNNQFFVHNTQASVSWEVINSTVPALNVTSESMTFEVTFMVSKVARQSNDQEWHIGINVIDSLTATGITESNLFAEIGMSDTDPINATPASFNMAFYGEVELPDGITLDWGAIKPGSDFAENQATTGSITFLSNGNFDTEISSSTLWQATNTAIDVADATLVTDPAVATSTTPQAFGLRFNDLDGTHALTGGSPNAETVNVEGVDLDNGLPATAESGVQRSYAVFLAISKDFQNATYNGEVIFLVSNNVEDLSLVDGGGQ